MAYGTPVAIAGDSSVFCLRDARRRYGELNINYLLGHDAVWSLSGRDGEPLSVVREGMHDRFLCGMFCECGAPLCPYAEYGCQCVTADADDQTEEMTASEHESVLENMLPSLSPGHSIKHEGFQLVVARGYDGAYRVVTLRSMTFYPATSVHEVLAIVGQSFYVASGWIWS